MNKDIKQTIMAALDGLAVALASHNHQWTNEERKLYEKAKRLLIS